MEKEIKTTLWIEDGAFRIEASFEDFDGGLAKWKEAFYTVWRHQMTWDFAYSIELIDRRQTGVYLRMLVRKNFLKNVEDMLSELGYRQVTQSSEHVGIVQLYEIDAPEAEDLFEVFAE